MTLFNGKTKCNYQTSNNLDILAMASSEKIVVAFDLYGTLLSTESIAQELAKQFGQEKSASIAATWRKYQLEYTWRLNSMGM